MTDMIALREPTYSPTKKGAAKAAPLIDYKMLSIILFL